MDEWTDVQIDQNRRLHLITLGIAMLIAIVTYPLQVFTSYRLLANRFSSPIYKLIILNGFLGIFQVLVHILVRHLPAFYECSCIYEFSQVKRVVWLAGYLMAFSYIVRIHCTFLIAINRFLRCRSGSDQWLRNDRRFGLSLLSNLLLPLLFAAPLPIFGDFHYVAIVVANEQIVYRPELPLANLNRLQNSLSIAPPLLYFALLAVSSCLLNTFVVHKLVSMRKVAGTPTVKLSTISVSERGLAVTSVSTMLAQVIMLVCFLILQVRKNPAAAALNIIPLTLNSAIPFWVLLATVPTVRHSLPSCGRPRQLVTMSTVSAMKTPSPQRRMNQSHFEYPRFHSRSA